VFRLNTILLAAGLALAGATATVLPQTAQAAGDLMKGREILPEIVLGDGADNDYAVENREITIETGKAYRLQITSKSPKEMKFLAPEFFRNIWCDQIVINDLEVHMNGGPAWLEFDDQGTIEVSFVAIKTGTYEWRIGGLEQKGMTGKIIVK
jgi:hypothetical protein